MSQQLIRDIEQAFLKTDLPDLRPGDTVKVMVRIREGNKERLQGYEGVIIRLSGSGLSATVTVRRVFQGVGVERVFLLHSPMVESIKVSRRGRVRRARIYYMRQRSGKAARIREKIGSLNADKNASGKKKGKDAAPAAQPQPAAKAPAAAAVASVGSADAAADDV